MHGSTVVPHPFRNEQVASYEGWPLSWVTI